jgi:hypothetical protein
MHFRDASSGLVGSQPVVSNPPAELSLRPLRGSARPIEEWLTTFHLASVVIDPYTVESAWILETAARVLRSFRGAAARVNFVVTADDVDARAFLGPLADEFLVFLDPDRAVVRALGLTRLPAFVFVQEDGTVTASAEGWDPQAWRQVAEVIASTTSWSRPVLPAAGDPAPFTGSPALG